MCVNNEPNRFNISKLLFHHDQKNGSESYFTANPQKKTSWNEHKKLELKINLVMSLSQALFITQAKKGVKFMNNLSKFLHQLPLTARSINKLWTWHGTLTTEYKFIVQTKYFPREFFLLLYLHEENEILHMCHLYV